MSFEHTVTPQGLRVYTDTIPTAETANIQVFVGAGSVHEPEELAGISHALEHCVFVSTEMFPDEKALRDFDGMNSISENADTFYTRTRYYASGPYIEPIMQRMGEVMFRSTYDPEAIANEMDVIRREMKDRRDSIKNMHYVALDYALFGKPYGREVGGYAEKLRFTPDQLRDYYKRHYTVANMAVVAVGNVYMEDILAGIEQYFEYPTEQYNPVTPPAPRRLGPTVTGLVRKESENARIVIGSPLDAEFIARYQANREVYDAAIAMLNVNCFETMRADAGIAYNAGVYLETDNHPNAWSLQGYLTTDTENVDQARQLFGEVFQRPSSDYRPNAVHAAIGSTRGLILSEMDALETRADMHIKNLQSLTEPENLQRVAERVRNLDPVDVTNALDDIVAHWSTSSPVTHITGTKEAMKSVEHRIDQSLIV